MIQALPPGTHIGHFKLLKALGQGGFGITYVAWDSQLERTVVLKECFPVELCCRQEDGSLAPRSESLEPLYRAAMDDMRREARTLAGLHHERIVPVYDVADLAAAIGEARRLSKAEAGFRSHNAEFCRGLRERIERL